MVQITREGRVVETAREARQGERGPSVLVVLTVSMVAVAIVFAVLWYLFTT
jgi:type II secretory pathway component PulK